MPGRAPVSAAPTPRNDNVARNPAELGIAKKLHFSGRGTAALDALEKDIIAVIEQLKAANDESEEVLLIIDQPDFLLAATGASMGIGATEMSEWVMGLQQVSLDLVDSYLTKTKPANSLIDRSCYSTYSCG